MCDQLYGYLSTRVIIGENNKIIVEVVDYFSKWYYDSNVIFK